MVLKYHISPYPALTENMIVRIWEAQSDGPNGWVWQQVIPERNAGGIPTPGAGHQVKTTITANGLDRVVHIVRLFTAVGGILLHEYNVEPMAESTVVFDPIRFKIGDGEPDTPAATSDTYENALLLGLDADDYTVHRNNYGVLFPAVHYNPIPIMSNPTKGGFQLMPGDQFNDTEEFVIQRKTLTGSLIVNDSVVCKWFAGMLDINGDDSFVAAHLRRLFRFMTAAKYTFGAADAVPIGYGFCFTTTSANVTGTVEFLNAPLLWASGNKNSIQLKPYSEACFVFDGTFWNCVYLVESTQFNSGPVATPSGTVLAVGSIHIGDVPSGDPVYNIFHGLNIQGGAYEVFLQVKSNNPAAYFRDNRIASTWWKNDNPQNKFYFSLQEITGEAQNISVSWLIIKT